jgi:hypothetical protein
MRALGDYFALAAAAAIVVVVYILFTFSEASLGPFAFLNANSMGDPASIPLALLYAVFNGVVAATVLMFYIHARRSA